MTRRKWMSKTKIITINDQTFDMKRGEHIALLAKQLDALEYGNNGTTNLVKQQIPFYLDDIRESRGKKRIITKDAEYYINLYGQSNYV